MKGAPGAAMPRQDEPARLTMPQRRAAAAMLTGAFLNDPLYRMVLPEPDRRRGMLISLHHKVLRYCDLYGSIYVQPSLEGIACWLPPQRPDVTVAGIIRSGLCLLPFAMRPGAYLRFNAYMTYSGRLRKAHAPEHYWYMWVLGVDPARQGSGIGSRLLRPVLEKADAGGTACFLETENEENLGFYEAQGFRVVAGGKIPGYDASTWSMIRPPGD